MLQSKSIEWLNGYRNTTYIYAACKSLTSHKNHIEIEGEGMEKDIPCKCKSKEIWDRNAYMRQNRLKKKRLIKETKNSLYNDQGNNSKRR